MFLGLGTDKLCCDSEGRHEPKDPQLERKCGNLQHRSNPLTTAFLKFIHPEPAFVFATRSVKRIPGVCLRRKRMCELAVQVLGVSYGRLWMSVCAWVSNKRMDTYRSCS